DVETDAWKGRGPDREAGLVHCGTPVPRCRIGGDLLVRHQRAIEARGRAAAEDLGEKVERLGLALPGTKLGRRTPVALKHRLLDTRVRERQATLSALRRLLRTVAGRRLGAARGPAIALLGQNAHLLGRHVAGNDERGIVRRIEAVVKGERVLARQSL